MSAPQPHPHDPHFSDDEIAQRAYEIWQRYGEPLGKHEEHWQQAIKELTEEHQEQANNEI